MFCEVSAEVKRPGVGTPHDLERSPVEGTGDGMILKTRPISSDVLMKDVPTKGSKVGAQVIRLKGNLNIVESLTKVEHDLGDLDG